MGEKTKIEWAHDTFNPWWGCVRVSPGCEHCYAETFAKRVGKDVWGARADRRMLSDDHWRQPVKWNKQASASGKPRRVFCGSMCDVFEDRDDLVAPRARLLKLIEATPALTWMLLTKRPENMVRLAERWPGDWPLNVWAMCTVEDQKRADERIPHLLQVPAVVRGLSCEPLLGAVDLATHLMWSGPYGPNRGISWVIAGGESGSKARPMSIEWARSIRDQCQAAGVAFHFKQWGEWSPLQVGAGILKHSRREQLIEGLLVYRVGKKHAGRDLDGRTWDEFPRTEGP